MRTGIERHDGFFPVGGLAHFMFVPTEFTRTICSPDRQHFHVVNLFNGLPDRGLRRLAMHLERKRTATRLVRLRRIEMRRRLVRALFGHERPLDDVVNIHL